MANSCDDFSQVISEEVTCPICLEELKEPKMLLCSHNICRECLERMSVNNLIHCIVCPVCRTVTPIPKGGVRCLPTNTAIVRVVEATLARKAKIELPKALANGKPMVELLAKKISDFDKVLGVLNEIHEKADKLIDVIRNQEANLCREVEELYGIKCETINGEKSDLDKLHSSASKTVQEAETILEQTLTDPTKTINVAKALKEQIEEITKLDLTRDTSTRDEDLEFKMNAEANINSIFEDEMFGKLTRKVLKTDFTSSDDIWKKSEDCFGKSNKLPAEEEETRRSDFDNGRITGQGKTNRDTKYLPPIARRYSNLPSSSDHHGLVPVTSSAKVRHISSSAPFDNFSDAELYGHGDVSSSSQDKDNNIPMDTEQPQDGSGSSHDRDLFGDMIGANGDLLSLLLETGASVEARNKNKQTPLDCATDHQVSEILLDITASNIEKKTGFSSLLPEEVGVFLRTVVDGDIRMVGTPPFAVQVRFRLNLEEDEEDGGEEQCKSEEEHLCHPLCHCEKCIKWQKLTQRSLERSVHVNCADEDGITPLHVAAIRGYTDITNLLLRHGANPNAKNISNQQTPLHLACQYNHPEVAESLLKYRAEVNIKDYKHNTPLHFCCINGHVAPALLLLEHKPNVDVQNYRGNTPLHEAVRWHFVALVRILLDHGASVTTRNNMQLTPMQYAKDDDVVQVFETASNTCFSAINNTTPL